MTPSQQAKAHGYKTLSELASIVGVDRQTLDNWAKNKPKLFQAVLLGARLIKID
jgi:hypothetical protein